MFVISGVNPRALSTGDAGSRFKRPPAAMPALPSLDTAEYMCKLHLLDCELDLRRKRVATMEKANRAAERLAQSTRDSFATVLDHAVGVQERNVRFTQGIVDDSIKELRSQVESNREMTQELIERAHKQREAFQTLLEESLDAYVDLLYAPLSYYKEGLRLVESEMTGGRFPIPNYDELNVEEVKGMLDGLTAAQLREVRDYEKRNKNRETLIEQFDRKLRAASA
jgi:hypothetical protein